MKDIADSYDKDYEYSIEEFSSVWSNIMIKHTRLLNLFSILHTVLEKMPLERISST